MISFAKQNNPQWKIGRKEISISSHSFPKDNIKVAQYKQILKSTKTTEIEASLSVLQISVIQLFTNVSEKKQ